MIRFSVITPCRNADRLLPDTMWSVLSQTALLSKQVEVEYIVVDGASSDQTVETATRIAAQYKNVHVISEPDSGMYDALAKGLMRSTGDIIGYINAGDAYSSTAFASIAEHYVRTSASWITGTNAFLSEYGDLVRIRHPLRYRTEYIQRGLHTGFPLPYIQQESTFWSRSLLGRLDEQFFTRLRNLRLAGDYFLWYTFSHHTDLQVIPRPIGMFREHQGQLSESRAAYLAEVRSFADTPHLKHFLEALAERSRWIISDTERNVDSWARRASRLLGRWQRG